MAKNYEVGGKYYLPVTVKEIDTGYRYPVTLEYVDCESRDTTDSVCITDEPDLLLTAEEIAIMPHTERDDALEELKAKVANLQEESEKLTAWYNEANKTASEATEANDELKAKVAELRAENDKLKQKLKDAEGACNVVADTSIKRNNRVKTMEAVIDALVEKIRRLEGDD